MPLTLIRFRPLALVLAVLPLAACMAPVAAPVVPQPAMVRPTASAPLPPETAAENFVRVVARMEPQVEAECRARAQGRNCDYQIVIDDRPGQSPNAFQTLDRNGRPIVGFTLALIADARNADEIAFVVGHEAAHHIAGHIPQCALVQR